MDVNLNRNKNVRIILLIGIIILGIVFSGCSQSTVNSQDYREPGEIIPVYTIADAVGDWGFPSPWGHYQRGPGYIRMSLIFETLVWKDEQGIVPALASEWNYDPATKTYTFVLEDDIRWHDGKPLTAQDVVFTFQYMKEHPYSWGNLSSVSQVVSTRDNEVRITLHSDYAPFLSNVAATVPIIPRHIWENVEDPAEFTDAEAAIGSGPFKYADYNREQGTYLYTANENYYGGKVQVQELRFVKINPQMAAASLTQGDVNAVSVQAELADQLQGQYTIIREAGSSNVKLMFNHRKSPLSAKEFRQAIAYAIDREELVAKAQRGYGVPGNPGIYAPGSMWYTPDAPQYHQDEQMVKELMTTLGYNLAVSQGRENGYWVKDGQEAVFSLLCDPDLIRTAEVLKEQLEKAGFLIEIQSVETKTRDSKIDSWDFDLALNMHGGLGGDPEMMNKFILVDDFNSARYKQNQELVDLIERQKSIMNEQDRKEIVDRIQKIYAEEIPALTLYYPNAYWAHDGQIPLFYTSTGIAIGVPIPLNRLSFVQE